jgi:hypothetical protein
MKENKMVVEMKQFTLKEERQKVNDEKRKSKQKKRKMNEKQKNMKEKQAKNFNETLVGQFC